MAFPVSEDKIVDAETALGIRFPDPLRNRLKMQNGGEVSASDDAWFLYPVRDASDRKRLSKTANDLVTETKNAREWRGFPPTAIAIASNGSGDLLILQPGLNDVFLWNHAKGVTYPISVQWEES